MFEIASLCLRVAPVGSRVTCNPIPPDSDEDWLCLVANIEVFAQEVEKLGFLFDGKYDPPQELNDQQFACFKRDNVDLIACCKVPFCDRFLAATHVEKRLNLLVKNDRIALFQAVLYGKQWTEEVELETPDF